MDKYEYKLTLDQIKNLVGKKEYETAAEIADSINWKKEKNVSTLCMAGEIYEKIKQYDVSREILLMAYDRSPMGRHIIFRLTQIAVKLQSFDEAEEYYEEFLESAPHDNMKYVLKYEIAKGKREGLKEQIAILEEFKEKEYTEEWAFELAYLYHKAGNSDKCVEVCDELILWFGEGRYVEKALELKMIYQPLNNMQEDKYRKFNQKKEEFIEVYPDDELESGEIVQETMKIPKIQANPSRFNTHNLQEELAKSMQQILNATEKETVTDTMDNIKKMVKEIPYLYMPATEEQLKEEAPTYGALGKDQEIDGALRIDFKEFLAEDYDGQISLFVPDVPNQEPQIHGQMSIEDVLAEWEKTKRAAEAALAVAEQRKLESVKARAMQQAEVILDRLVDLDATEEPEIEDWEVAAKEPEADSMEIETKPIEIETKLMEIEVKPMETITEQEEMIIEAGQEEMAMEDLKRQVTKPIPDIGKAIMTQELFPEIREEKEEMGSLSEEQKQIFSYFMPVAGMEQQLCQVLEGTMQRRKNNTASTTGNIIIMGGKGSGKTVLATNLIKTIQKEMEQSGKKVGKISAKVLNQKDIVKLLKTIAGGYLIIEKAGKLSRETIVKLSSLMESDTGGLLVIMEDTRVGIEKAMSKDINFARKFTEKIRIPIFTSDELVEFARAYAQEQECEIDDMGILALYNSISNIQRADEPTTLSEVKEIMDMAIERAARGGLKKFFGGKRYTESGYVILKEKDFDN